MQPEVAEDSPVGSAVAAASTRIEALIADGEISAAGRLPSERDLAQRFQLSRTTLRQALLRLSSRGIVNAAPHSGWFVTAAPLGEPPRTLISFTEMARRRGSVPRTRVLSHIVREATIDETQALSAPPLSPVLDVERLRSLGSTPICLDHAVILLSRTPGLEEVDLEDTSLYGEMTRLGTVPFRSNFVVEANGATEREVGLLQVPVGSPILQGTETCFDAIGNPLLTGVTRYRPNVYRFYSTMVRPR